MRSIAAPAILWDSRDAIDLIGQYFASAGVALGRVRSSEP